MFMRYHQLMTETVIRLEMRYGVLPVWKNPTHRQTSNAFMKCGNTLRGIVDGTGNLYIWEAADATHDDVEEMLSVGIKFQFLMLGQGVVETNSNNADAIAAIPALRRAYGGDFKVIRDNVWDDEG
jgi:hypothetical protein